jgi:hypothetical protein
LAHVRVLRVNADVSGLRTYNLEKLSLVTNFELPTHTNQPYFARLGGRKKFLHIMQSNINRFSELHRLNNDLAALRFYALQNVPHSASSEGIW